ncbi:hypothetical protein ScPMuIL_007836 [Solemya velum]
MTICLLKVWVCSVYVLAFAVYTGDATRKLVQLPRNPGNVGQAFTVYPGNVTSIIMAQMTRSPSNRDQMGGGPGGGLTTSLICEQCRQTGNTECIQRYCDGAFGGGAVTPEVIPSAGPWPRTSDVANWLCRFTPGTLRGLWHKRPDLQEIVVRGLVVLEVGSQVVSSVPNADEAETGRVYRGTAAERSVEVQAQ